jgi:hypothetical protein
MEQPLALLEGDGEEVPAVEMEQVEGVVDKRALGDRLLRVARLSLAPMDT